MTKPGYVSVIGILCVSAGVRAQERPAVAQKIATTYGLDSFGQIDAIRYTFNIDAGPRKASRSWTWEPKKGQVSYEGKDKGGNPLKVTYSRADVANQTAVVKEQVDPGFINDQYWLLFPFHLVWDAGATVTDAGMQKLPLGKGSARRVVVTYPSDVGYTPGDTWELYVGNDGRVREFVFHHGGAAKPNKVVATWTDYKKAGPLLFSLDHRGTADGNPVRIFFTDVAVKLAGSDNWVEAK